MYRTAAMLFALTSVASATDARRAVELASPSVVRVDARGRPLAPELESLLRSVGATWSDGRAQRGAGVAVERGFLTNAHVVRGAMQITLTRGDRSVPGRLVGTDSDLDLAWIMPEAPLDAPPIQWTDEQEIGSPVFTLGFPAGADLVVSAGVLSGQTVRGVQGRPRRTWLLTDALVQRGASGGPLVDEQGRALGLSTGGLTAAADGLGLVLPAQDIRARGLTWKAERARFLDVTCAPHARGVIIHGNTLENATVIAVQGQPVTDCRALHHAIRQHETLSLTRLDADGEEVRVELAGSLVGPYMPTMSHRDGRVMTVNQSGHLRGFDRGDRFEEPAAGAVAVQVAGKGWLILPNR